MNDFQITPTKFAIQDKDGGWIAGIEPYWAEDNGIKYIRSLYVTVNRPSYIPSVGEVTAWMIALRKQFNVSAPESPSGLNRLTGRRLFFIIKDEDIEKAVSTAMNRYGFTEDGYCRFTYYTTEEND